MINDDTERADETSLWLLGLIDGVTGAIVLATIAAVYAVAVGAWL
jgi:hypothetical protein